MIKASIKEKELVVDILYNAFVDINFPNSINFVVKQDIHRNKRLRFLMEYLFLKTINSGEIYISNNKKACILLHYPHKEKVTFKSILRDFKLAYKTIGLIRVYKVLKREHQLKKHHLKQDHIHPLIMGVQKDYQGKGAGVRLIYEVFNKHSTNKLPCILETTTKSNLKLYKKFGFYIFSETIDLGYPLYFLRKDFTNEII
ncbi:GNAT family N-acetyltransferase [uncultured Tenacibaculum sp.]|uniref:GNAT family N-acetyltransferase n=1 Tax=uncultured Tenacibaculum sp. TaxID=174713 RepID=UPI0026102464|nr:GNAT family N-acetyltransferase [uncultured Tenacibaculum sp.]